MTASSQFFLDGHVHCARFRDKAELVELLLARGIRGMVCTDHVDNRRHYYPEARAAYQAMRALGEAAGLRVYAGMEYSLDNDYLVYGLPMEALEQVCLHSSSRGRLLELVHAGGGAVFQAHPCRTRRGRFGFGLDLNADGYEVANGHHRHENNNALAGRLAKALGKPGCAGSDAHGRLDVGRAWMSLPAPPPPAELQLAEMLLAGQAEALLSLEN